MDKPHWEKKHDWWVEDFDFWVKQKSFFVGLLRKHPGDEEYKKCIRNVEKCLEKEQKAYKKLYGVRFNLRSLNH